MRERERIREEKRRLNRVCVCLFICLFVCLSAKSELEKNEIQSELKSLAYISNFFYLL